MDILTKYRLFNKKRMIILLVFFVGLFVSWFFISHMYGLTLGFDINEPDLGGNGREAQKLMIQGISTMAQYTDVMMYTTTIFPILIVAMAYFFYQEKTGMFLYQCVRGKSQKKVVLKSMFAHSLISATWFYVAFLIFMTVGYLFIGANNGDIPRNFFDGIFGTGFSDQHVYLYYVVQGFYTYFLFAFVLTFFSCAVALVANKQYQCILIPICFYFGLDILIGYNPVANQFLNLFQLTYTQGFYGYVNTNPTISTAFLPLIPLILPILISVCILIRHFVRGERVEF